MKDRRTGAQKALDELSELTGAVTPQRIGGMSRRKRRRKQREAAAAGRRVKRTARLMLAAEQHQPIAKLDPKTVAELNESVGGFSSEDE